MKCWSLGLKMPRCSKISNYCVMAGKFQILSEFFDFMKERKKWWLGPIVIMLLLLGLLIILTEGSAVAPFVYALF